MIKAVPPSRPWRPLRQAVGSLAQWLQAAWRTLAGRAVPSGSPTPPAPLPGSAALREGARLSERLDARARRRVA